MPEELNDQSTEVDVDSGIGSGEDSGSSSDAMTGDFFDDDAFYDEGFDAVVDNYGNPIKNDKGEDVKTMDEYRAMKDGKGADDQKKEPLEGENKEGEPSKFESLFQKDGEFDFDGLMKTSSSLKDFSYEMQSKVKPMQTGQSGPQQLDPKERIITSVKELQDKLNTERLEPIKKIYNETINKVTNVYQSSGQQLPPEVGDAIHRAINDIYLKEEGSIKTAIEDKRNEMIGEVLNQKTTESEMKEFKGKSSQNFKSVSDEMLPDVPSGKREEFLGELIFGSVNDKNEVQPGYGTDLVNAFFDESIGEKEFSSPDEMKQEYNNWWYKFSSNPAKVKLISMLSYARYLLANPDGLRGAYRKSFEKELATKNKGKNNQARSSGVAMNDEASDPLADYHRGIQR